MTDADRQFVVASDDRLIGLIRAARNRLLVATPALTHAVADALAKRLNDLGPLSITVIVDPDPEVYRLGFGHPEALDALRKASEIALFDLREQSGLRIGIVVSDDRALAFAPISMNIEAGSKSDEKPNAIFLDVAAADRILAAAAPGTGDSPSSPEIGNQPLKPATVEAMKSDLAANPPRPFDITRRLTVFSSRVQYVEFSASNYRLSTRQVALPPELIDLSDSDLKDRISGRIRAPLDGIGKIEVEIDNAGTKEKLQIDETWLKRERKRIEDEFTFQINNFGRVILYNDKKRFDRAIKRFEMIILAYQSALKGELEKMKANFRARLVTEYLPKWTQSPPKFYDRWEIRPSVAQMTEDLERFSDEIFSNTISFEAPEVKALYKNVAPENLSDGRFLEQLRSIMLKRRVPLKIIDSLFQTGDAAPETGSFRLETP
jgi:hypothetical protein